jgi:hypothetical protein
VLLLQCQFQHVRALDTDFITCILLFDWQNENCAKLPKQGCQSMKSCLNLTDRGSSKILTGTSNIIALYTWSRKCVYCHCVHARGLCRRMQESAS